MTLNNAAGEPLGFRQRIFGAGIRYAFGAADVGFVWTQARLDNVAEIPDASMRLNNFEVNGKYNFTPAFSAGIAYTFTAARASAEGTTIKTRNHQVGVQGDYALSRRTDVYAEAVYQLAQVRGDDAVVPMAAINGAGGASSGRNQAVATVGLRHRF